MAVLAWAMMGIAVWHFTVFVPDRYLWGIVGAFLGAAFGAILVGLLIHGLDVPARDDTTIVTALEGIPGALLGMGFMYAVGVRRDPGTPARPGSGLHSS